ncbi:MAG: protein-glutamate O-methyltransferase CheR [Ectothiorhodospiraceae bacterium]|nr:protein-glutamate O-methyltransferase CheR [Ectothiorhodospiraceae bacterium]MCH8504605.1 protein-glutamate O-methyltransferase CheR [Ectothiorhodospiraceae bacterium]
MTNSIEPEHYKAFRQFLEQSCGIVLGENKQYLVSSRLGQLMQREGVPHLGELVNRIQHQSWNGLRGRVIEAMTTNETQWFRDGYPFQILQDVLFPEFVKQKKQQLRIWSAACSSGQEPYSISVALQEFQQRGIRLDAEILGTDISPAMVSHTRLARYATSAINRGLTLERRQRYFREAEPGLWEVRPEIRSRVRVQQHNLLETYSALGRFDIIFCRNVLIYFSAESREDILRRMCQQLAPGGYLIVGASESLARHAGELEMVRTHGGVIYRLRSPSKKV